MANGVEVRVPYLDPDLIALAGRLPTRYKQHGRSGKWVLRKAMESYLPHDVIYRSKTGFGAPLRHWLRVQLRPLVEEILSEDSLERRGLFDPAAVRRLVELNAAQRVDAAYSIFSMICIELWCRMFVDRPRCWATPPRRDPRTTSTPPCETRCSRSASISHASAHPSGTRSATWCRGAAGWCSSRTSSATGTPRRAPPSRRW
jgi:asparagine synthase (glutamine-hydrolysing)